MERRLVPSALATPYYLIDETYLTANLRMLRDVADRAGCKILLAQKAFSSFAFYPLISRYLDGTTASGLYEARLGKERFGKETHVYSPAYAERDWEQILQYSDHIVFNSCAQMRRFAPRAKAAGKQVGLRVNPECSTQQGHEIYDPCAPFSRLGCTADNLDADALRLADGLHLHTLCEQNADALVQTLEAFERKFGQYLHGMRWLNLGGGHHITRDDYDRELLIRTVRRLQATYDVQVYLEPGEAVVLNSGFLVASVLEVLRNGCDIAILDTSAACHMPDVLEMPYRPPVQDAGAAGEKAHTYRLAGPTCLSGDVIGDYSFDRPLQQGDRVVFCDMALYTIVKNNTFNGMPLPSIVRRDADGADHVVKAFDYADFESRLS